MNSIDTKSASPQALRLSDEHKRVLFEDSAISANVVEARGYRTISNKLEARAYGFSQAQVGAGLLIPIWNVYREVSTFQIRRDEPRVGKDGRAIKYETPRGGGLCLDVNPLSLESLRDPAVALWIIEGSKKVDAAVSHELCCIGLMGVWGWRGKNENGGTAALADWEVIPFKSEKGPRRVYLAFDSDVTTKPSVRKALLRLQRFLESRGAEVRVVLLPEGEDGSKVGLDDYLAKGGDLDSLRDSAVPSLTPEFTRPKDHRPLVRNFVLERDGEDSFQVAIPADEIAVTALAAGGGFPKCLGESLFIEGPNDDLRFLETSHDLFGWLHRVSQLSWATGNDRFLRSLISKSEFVPVLTSHAERFEEYSRIPFEPVLPEVYVPSRWEKTPTGDDNVGVVFDFLQFFCPATKADEAVLLALFLTPCWGGPPGARPLFVVTGEDGCGAQEIGKSSLVEKISAVYGGAQHLSIGDSNEPLAKQLVSDSAASRRVVVLDNVDGLTRSRELAELVTAPFIDGRPAYGKQRRRANRLTWCATGVSPALDGDLSSRAMPICLKQPADDPSWSEKVDEFIEAHRDRLILGALEQLRRFKHRLRITTRFPAWCRQVLAVSEDAEAAIRKRSERVQAIDAESEGALLLLSELAKSVSSWQGEEKEFTAADLCDTWFAATRQSVNSSWLVRKLKELGRRGAIPDSAFYRKFSNRHGSPWVANAKELLLFLSTSQGEPFGSPGEATEAHGSHA